MAKRLKFMHPAHKHLYKTPLLLHEGKLQYVWDHTGKRYLDLFGGVCTIAAGHAHPRVVDAAKKQLDLIHHTTPLYLNPNTFELMEAIHAHLPKGEEWIFNFTNSGSEATDFAMLMARVYTRNHLIVAQRNGYHGMSEGSRGTVGVAGWKHNTPSAGGVIRAISPIEYRGLLGSEPADVPKYVEDLKYQINVETPGAIAGFIAERIQGVGGLYPLLSGYLPKAYEAVRAAGGVCISDEVQCGFGRLGSHFWGFELDGVVPDIITCAKSIGNGAPMGLVISKKKIAESIKDQAYFNTYGGNPVSCAMALANLRVIEEENLQQNSKVVGDHNLEGLRKLQRVSRVIGSVRGQGFIIGIELVSDKENKIPLSRETVGDVLESLREQGVLLGRGGMHGNVLRLQGPMCATKADIDFFHYALERALSPL